jgi:hypothetical protein
MNITAKPFDQMTLAELRKEHKYWNEIIGNRTEGWGSALHVAIEFKKECAAMIARREKEQDQDLRTTTGVTNREAVTVR